MPKIQYRQDLAGDSNSSKSLDINNITRADLDSKEIKPKGDFLFKDILWKVLPANDQQNLNMMKRIFETADQVSALSSRFLAVRYDLHLKNYQPHNQVIDVFHKKLFGQLRKRYPKSFVSYIWVRERNEADVHHYHYALMMDGNYIRSPNYLNEIVKMCWEAAGGTVWFPDNMSYFVKPNDVDVYSKLMIRLSYFGKLATKESTSVCKKRIGFGIRKVKRTNNISAGMDKNVSDVKNLSDAQDVESNFVNQSTNTGTESELHLSGLLDKYFLNEHSLESLKPPVQHVKFSLFKQWLSIERSDWKWHRLNYVYEAVGAGVRLSEYADKFSLKLTRVYANFREIGGQGLRIIHWAWHRRCFYFSDLSVDEYITTNHLYSKIAIRQLQRRPMSDFWSKHFDNYYRNYWLQGYTVSYYCHIYSLNVSTARRYLVDFSNTRVIDPFILKPWL